eukprot:117280-Chlamydomonas_euryale.AAC.1
MHRRAQLLIALACAGAAPAAAAAVGPWPVAPAVDQVLLAAAKPAKQAERHEARRQRHRRDVNELAVVDDERCEARQLRHVDGGKALGAGGEVELQEAGQRAPRHAHLIRLHMCVKGGGSTGYWQSGTEQLPVRGGSMIERLAFFHTCACMVWCVCVLEVGTSLLCWGKIASCFGAPLAVRAPARCCVNWMDRWMDGVARTVHVIVSKAPVLTWRHC